MFKYCDDKGLALLDFSDLRAVLQYLAGDGAAELKDYGGMSKQTVGVLLREMVELEQQGAEAFFGEPEFEIDDLMQTERDGRGLVSILELSDVQDKPALFSTFMLWMLASLYNHLPEVGDIDKPKLVFFFDEAHLLFDGATQGAARRGREGRAARSARRASASSSSRRARRTFRRTCSASWAIACSTRCARSRRTTTRRSRRPRARSQDVVLRHRGDAHDAWASAMRS